MYFVSIIYNEVFFLMLANKKIQIENNKGNITNKAKQTDFFDTYWIWRSMVNSYYGLKQTQAEDTKLQTNKKRLNYLKKQIILNYLKNFFLFPFWLLSFLISNYFKGKNNLWTNLKTIATKQEFKPLRFAILFQIIFIIILVFLGYFIFYKYSNPSFATSYNWTQTDWSTASTTATALDPDNQTGWSYYESASSTITAGANVQMSFTIATSTDTTDTDFNTGTTSTVTITGTGSSASLVLLKPGGASCTLASECSSNSCDGGFCYSPPCAGLTSLSYSGQSYGLVEIGTQCWFSQNLNVGTMLASGATTPSNDSLIEKWCFNNSPASCTTYGGLYTWAEANQLATTCDTTSCTPATPSQGICPAGWHIPTDAEIKTLEVYLGMCTGAGAGCVDATGWRGTDQCTQLKSGGSSGFNGLLAGIRYTDGSFVSQGSFGNLWSASEDSATNAWSRNFNSVEARVYRSNDSKAYGFSVRCLKN